MNLVKDLLHPSKITDKEACPLCGLLACPYHRNPQAWHRQFEPETLCHAHVPRYLNAQTGREAGLVAGKEEQWM